MYYPWLDVPLLTAPMIIAIIALFHVFVSHYAVGGGLLLALENGRALRSGDAAYRDYLKKHAKFFILLTVPYGGVTGVGVWFSIGLASPLATSELIRIFVFGWAIEWCFFLLEIVSAFVFYYAWDRLSPKASSIIGWIYGLSAWISLVLITGITAFMLNASGIVGDWETTGNFWHAFLNVQFLPQTIARTGGALILASLYFLAHAAFTVKDASIRETVAKRMRVPSFVGLFLLMAGVVGWLFFLPETSRLTLERAAATNIFAGAFLGIVAGIALLLFLGPCLKPREVSAGMAVALLMMGIGGVSVAEFVREAVRKPYVVDRLVYGDQVFRTDVPEMRQIGMLYKGTWTSYALDDLQEKYPDLAISPQKYLGVESIHLVPPAAEEPKVESTPEETAPSEDNDSSTASRDSRVAFYQETVALTQSSFTPVATSSPTPSRLTAPNGGEMILASPNAPLMGTNSLAAEANRRSGSQGSVVVEQGAQFAQPVPQANANLSSVAPSIPVVSGVSQTQTTPIVPASTNARNDALPTPSVSSLQSSSVDAPVSPNLPIAATAPEVSEASKSIPELLATNAADSLADAESSVEPMRTRSPEELDREVNGPIARGNEDLLKVERADRLSLGRMMFLHHCNACHAAEHGYSAVGPLVSGLDSKEISSFAMRLNHSHFYMPPWAGTEVEAELLGEYLESIAADVPNNAFMKEKERKTREEKSDVPDAEAQEDETLDPDASSTQGETSSL
ncbi:MAG: cytochrome ubiquinol oxidase subunit I [Planctomycetia bacterium]|nr:cytochrome ubiquinol oxidase subunit I [Planctomycetia bacterium]